VIPSLEDHSFVAQKQDNTKATFTCARNPEDGIIKWEKDSTSVYNLVRALTYPYPGAFTYYNGKRIAIWSCEVYDIPVYEGVVPGKVIKIIRGKGVVVLCSQGAVLIRKIQVENENSVIADDVIKSIRATLG
jgi:methionyl-tRNA formyltransferase